MKAVILCGGKGLRMGGSANVPKPLVQVGSMPVLWHIMKIYGFYGITDFILCLGHNGQAIKEYFLNLTWRTSDFELAGGKIRYFRTPEQWNIIFADTGIDTMTGGRIKRIEQYIDEEEFLLTYGDGIADLQVDALVDYHRKMGKLATVTGIQRHSGYGIIEVRDGLAKSFQEKPLLDGWVNGGFFVLNRQVFNYIGGDQCVWEEEPLNQLVRDQELAVYSHKGFWQGLDTVKDVHDINTMWNNKCRPWVKWEQNYV